MPEESNTSVTIGAAAVDPYLTFTEPEYPGLWARAEGASTTAASTSTSAPTPTAAAAASTDVSAAPSSLDLVEYTYCQQPVSFNIFLLFEL